MPYADHDGVRIHYHVEGDGPPLVMQAGYTLAIGAWYQWGYVDALKDDYRLILIDPRGHGASDKPHDPAAYETQTRAGDVIAVLDALGVQKAHYLGYSMGGRIGYDLAKLAPERLASLMIGASSPFASKAGYQDLLAQGMEAFLAQQPVPEHVLTPEFRALFLANDVKALMAASIDRPSVEDILPTLKFPCLLYAGDADAGYENFKRAAALIPGATFETLPGLDHWAGIYRSDLALPVIQSFLKRVMS